MDKSFHATLNCLHKSTDSGEPSLYQSLSEVTRATSQQAPKSSDAQGPGRRIPVIAPRAKKSGVAAGYHEPDDRGIPEVAVLLQDYELRLLAV